MAALDNLIREVQEQKTAIASAKTLIADLAQRLRDAAGNETAIQALADELDASQADLAAAVAANTPGANPGGSTEPPAPEV